MDITKIKQKLELETFNSFLFYFSGYRWKFENKIFQILIQHNNLTKNRTNIAWNQPDQHRKKISTQP